MRVLLNIDVPELAPAIQFYTSALGLQFSRIIDADVAELTGASCVIYLLEQPAEAEPARSVAESRRYSRHWTPVHMDFVVDDVQTWAQRAIEAGASQQSECRVERFKMHYLFRSVRAWVLPDPIRRKNI